MAKKKTHRKKMYKHATIALLLGLLPLTYLFVIGDLSIIYRDLQQDPLNYSTNRYGSYDNTLAELDIPTLKIRFTTSPRTEETFRDKSSPFMRDGKYYIWITATEEDYFQTITDVNITGSIEFHYGFKTTPSWRDIGGYTPRVETHNLTFEAVNWMGRFLAQVEVDLKFVNRIELKLGFERGGVSIIPEDYVNLTWDNYIIPLWWLDLVQIAFVILIIEVFYLGYLKYQKRGDEIRILVKAIESTEDANTEDLDKVLEQHRKIMGKGDS